MGSETPIPPGETDHDLTDGLAALSRGEPNALERVLPLVYARLREMAEARMQRERAGHTLQPTALVHEAFLRLGSGRVEYRDQGHFFAVAARAMREVLIDHARTRGRDRRGGDMVRVPLGDHDVATPQQWSQIDVIELDDALTRLAAHDELGARVVELRFFAGLPVERIAEYLGITDRTVRRRWVYAKAWLLRELSGDSADPDAPLPPDGGAR